jgi:hydrogenase small subunit
MKVTRRQFLKICGASAAALGISATDLALLEKALANENGPTIIWLQGAGCTGCSESFLNWVSSSGTPSQTAADVLIDSINLVYHPNLMALAGQSAVQVAEDAYGAGGYVLAVEGGVPTKFAGNTCWAWSYNGKDVTFQQAVLDLASRAAGILCVGTCASWGGLAAAPPNPTAVKGVRAATGKGTINIAGCPPHPEWIVWVVAQLILGKTIALDSYARPKAIFSKTVHDQCPRRESEEANVFGQDLRCVKELGCRGPDTRANCPAQLWNNKANWCCDANALCIGCTDPRFPFDKLTSH